MQHVIDFALELDKLKAVTRKVKPLGLDRYENPAEHTWQIALLATALEPYAARPVDIGRVVAMLLVHDVGEIDTGDVIAFAEEGLAQRKTDERAAVRRIFGLLPDGQARRFLELWEEFEAETSADARFAHAVDRVMPVLLNLANNGQSWVENGITYDRVVRRVEGQIKTGCPALWDYVAMRLADAQRRGWFGTAG
jgi:5'-deoxynucleotidase YfbR-like HD superfamily hydrolase